MTREHDSVNPWRMAHGARWYDKEGSELAGDVNAIVDHLSESYRYRDRMDEEARMRVEPRLGELPGEGIIGSPVYVRRIKALAESVQADIVGRQRPKPVAVTTGSDWRVRRKAKRRDRFVQAILSDECGHYSDAWDAAADVLLDACYYGTGVLGVFADRECQRIRIERVLARELFVDPWETRLEKPRNIFRRTPWDKDALIAAYPESADAIRSAPGPRDDDRLMAHDIGSIDRASDRVMVTEAWRADRGEDDPGVYALCVPGACLHHEHWESERMPFAFVRWTRSRESFWGVSLVSEMKDLEAAYNDGLERILQSVILRSGSRVFYEEGSIDAASLEANDEEVHIAVKPGSMLPRTDMPPVLTPGELDVYRYIYGLQNELTGISEMLQTGGKPGGVTAASALRTLRDTGSRRQALRVRAFERMFVDIYKRVCDAATMLAADDPEFYADWPGSGFVEEIRWAETDLGDERYHVAVETSSMLTETPGGRIQALQELYQSGLIDGDTFMRTSQDPDLENIFSRSNAEYEWNESLIDRMLDYDADSDEAFPPELALPEGFLSNVPGALVQFGSAYYQARKDGAPEPNLELLRDYIIELQRLEAGGAAQEAAMSGHGQSMAAAAGAGVPPGMPPGMPPMPPGMPPGMG